MTAESDIERLNEKARKFDKSIELSLRAMMALLVFALTIIFYSMWNSIDSIKNSIGGVGGLNDRMRSIEIKLDEYRKEAEKQDQKIEVMRAELAK